MKITAQDDQYFSLAEMKAYLRVEHDADQDVIARCVDSAVTYYENATGLFLRSTTFEQRFTESYIELVTRPWVEIVSAKDDDGVDISTTVRTASGQVTVVEWNSTQLGALNLKWKVGAQNRTEIAATSAQAVRAIMADCYVNRSYSQPVQLYPGSIAAGMLFGEARVAV
tara:strand:+ start:736 stop:1242 length:507 start_codon:yes stop_codon:yes gene_type:complete